VVFHPSPLNDFYCLYSEGVLHDSYEQYVCTKQRHRSQLKREDRGYRRSAARKRRNIRRRLYYSGWFGICKEYLIYKHGKQCMRCGEKRRLTIDHIVPIKRRPDLAGDVNNMQLLCAACNREKGCGDDTDYRH